MPWSREQLLLGGRNRHWHQLRQRKPRGSHGRGLHRTEGLSSQRGHHCRGASNHLPRPGSSGRWPWGSDGLAAQPTSGSETVACLTVRSDGPDPPNTQTPPGRATGFLPGPARPIYWTRHLPISGAAFRVRQWFGARKVKANVFGHLRRACLVSTFFDSPHTGQILH